MPYPSRTIILLFFSLPTYLLPTYLLFSMLTIRLSRVGKNRSPIYRIVVMPKQRDPWAKSVEILGHYNPSRTPHELVVKAERVKYWISQGAEVSDTLWNLFLDEKLVEGKKRSKSHISGTRRKKLDEAAAETKKKEENAPVA